MVIIFWLMSNLVWHFANVLDDDYPRVVYKTHGGDLFEILVFGSAVYIIFDYLTFM